MRNMELPESSDPTTAKPGHMYMYVYIHIYFLYKCAYMNDKCSSWQIMWYNKKLLLLK